MSFHVSGFNPFYLPQWPPTVFVPTCPSFPCSDKPPKGHSYPDAVLQMLDEGEYVLPSTSCYILTACSILVRGFNIYKVNIRQSNIRAPCIIRWCPLSLYCSWSGGVFEATSRRGRKINLSYSTYLCRGPSQEERHKGVMWHQHFCYIIMQISSLLSSTCMNRNHSIRLYLDHICKMF